MIQIYATRSLHHAMTLQPQDILVLTKHMTWYARMFIWPKMVDHIKSFVTTCDTCQRIKSSSQLPAGLLQPLPTPGQQWEQVSMDFIVELPPTQDGYNVIIVFVDRLSKMVHLQPTKTTATAIDVANIFFNTVFRLHGLPRVIVSDRDPKFTSKFWQMLFKLTDTKLTLSTAFHPQTDGQTERANRTLEQYLRAFVNYKQDNWASLLPVAEFTINNAKNASTGFSPFYLANGCHPVTPTSLINPRSCLIPAASDYLDHLQTVLSTAKDNLRTAQDHQANYAN